MRALRVFVIAWAALLGGCVTVVLGTDQQITFNSDVAQSFSDNLLGNGAGSEVPPAGDFILDEQVED